MTSVTHTIEFANAAWAQQRAYVMANAKLKAPTIPGNLCPDQTVVICGAGPSLATMMPTVLDRVRPNQVWGCNSALRWLSQHGFPVSHGFAVAGEDGLIDDWKPFPNVHYILSSGVAPLVPRLLAKRHRKFAFYHVILGPNVGFDDQSDEAAWYARLFPGETLLVLPTGGFNVTNIAVCLALGMGFARIIVVGADCCLALSPDARPDPNNPALDDRAFVECHRLWKSRQQMYADGRDPVSVFGDDVVILDGVIAGRRFASRPDMLLSAVHLVDLAKEYPGRVQLVGDTLPNWLRQHPDDLWRPLMPKAENGIVTNLKTEVLDTAKGNP